MFIEYKQGEKHAGKNAARSESMDTFQDCGMLLTNEEVVIDIDHLPKESIKAIKLGLGEIHILGWKDADTFVKQIQGELNYGTILR